LTANAIFGIFNLNKVFEICVSTVKSELELTVLHHHLHFPAGSCIDKGLIGLNRQLRGLCKIGIGKIGGSAMEAMGRQPEAAGDLRNNMIVAAALVEGVALLAIVVCILALFI
jgi:ATP synthase F0 subunit c